MWFSQANAVGLGVELQLAAVRKALTLLDQIPAEAFLSVNVGPDAISSLELHEMLRARADPRRRRATRHR